MQLADEAMAMTFWSWHGLYNPGVVALFTAIGSLAFSCEMQKWLLMTLKHALTFTSPCR